MEIGAYSLLMMSRLRLFFVWWSFWKGGWEMKGYPTFLDLRKPVVRQVANDAEVT